MSVRLQEFGEVEAFLSKDLGDAMVAVMPDFFVDRIVKTGFFNEFVKQVKGKVAAGGGSIHGILQREAKGGNAVNLAYALGKFEVNVHLVTVADEVSQPLLRDAFATLPNVLVKVFPGRPGYTTALEFGMNGREVNVMLSDLGDVADFGPERLDGAVASNISKADLVAVTNWAANRKGSELAHHAFTLGKKAGSRTFLDPADFTRRAAAFAEFVKETSVKGLLDSLGVNENEARSLAEQLSLPPLPLQYDRGDIVRAAKSLSDELVMTLDLHTPIGSCSASKGEAHFFPRFKVEQRIATGAGDVWNAADIYGYLTGMPPTLRMMLANASAALFISSPRADAPSKGDVRLFLEKHAK